MIIELLILTNLLRPTPLILDDNLSIRATKRAEQLYENNQWSHYNWGSSFMGTDCKYLGENLAKDFNTYKDINNAFLNSLTHKRNIMNPNYNKIGIGQYKNITVELFCGVLQNYQLSLQ